MLFYFSTQLSVGLWTKLGKVNICDQCERLESMYLFYINAVLLKTCPYTQTKQPDALYYIQTKLVYTHLRKRTFRNRVLRLAPGMVT